MKSFRQHLAESTSDSGYNQQSSNQSKQRSNKKSIRLEVTLTSDSDCYTVIDGESFVMDDEVGIDLQLSKSTYVSRLNSIIKTLNGTEYKVLHKQDIPNVMRELNSELVSILETIKKTPFEDIKKFEQSKGGNQYFTVKVY